MQTLSKGWHSKTAANACCGHIYAGTASTGNVSKHQFVVCAFEMHSLFPLAKLNRSQMFSQGAQSQGRAKRTCCSSA